MTKRQYSIFISVLIVFIAAFILLFFIPSRTDDDHLITLPDENLVDIDASSSGAIIGRWDNSGSAVVITSDNVRDVIAALKRPENFSLSMVTELFYGDKSAASHHTLSHAENTTLVVSGMPNQTSQENFSLFTDDTVYTWKKGNSSFFSAPKGRFSYDSSASVPTYEDVVLLSASSILDAGYAMVDDIACIYVLASTAPGYEDAMYVSVEYGLLVYCESTYNGELIYRCSAESISIDSVDPASLVLPDGTLPS